MNYSFSLNHMHQSHFPNLIPDYVCYIYPTLAYCIPVFHSLISSHSPLPLYTPTPPIQYYTPHYAAAFEREAIHRLNSCDRLTSVTSLLYTLTSHSDIAVKRRFESTVYRYLDSADVVTLSNLAETFNQVCP